MKNAGWRRAYIAQTMPNPNISVPASLIGEPTRAAILMLLVDGRAHAAGAIADAVAVSAQSASNHLALLVQGDLLSVIQQGRHRYYRIASDDVAQVIEGLSLIAKPLRHACLCSGAAADLRLARRCYRHLAGRLGVCVHDALLARGWMAATGTTASHRTEYQMSAAGLAWLDRVQHSGDLGAQLGAAATGVSCLDWTERRPHLGGALGVALLGLLEAGGWVRASTRRPDRVLRITDPGHRFFLDQLGIDAAALHPQAKLHSMV